MIRASCSTLFNIEQRIPDRHLLRRIDPVVTRAIMRTPEFAKSRDESKRVEMRFAHLKTHHRLERMRLSAYG
jgi:hypothetical protein